MYFLSLFFSIEMKIFCDFVSSSSLFKLRITYLDVVGSISLIGESKYKRSAASNDIIFAIVCWCLIATLTMLSCWWTFTFDYYLRMSLTGALYLFFMIVILISI